LIGDIGNGKHDPTLIGHFAKPIGYRPLFDVVRQPQEGVDMIAKEICLHHAAAPMPSPSSNKKSNKKDRNRFHEIQPGKGACAGLAANLRRPCAIPTFGGDRT
jgi:hypothetical protein